MSVFCNYNQGLHIPESNSLCRYPILANVLDKQYIVSLDISWIKLCLAVFVNI